MSGKTAAVKLDSVKGNIHFVGIGGIGMSALARLLLAEGKKVSGSDKENNPITDELSRMGADIHVGHDAKNIEGAALLVVSTAITEENPELAAARAKGLPVAHRSAVLASLTARKKLLAVSGTHGKTTTTGMLAQLFIDNDMQPTVVVGGVFSKIAANSVYGTGEYFIAEADESDRTHAALPSYIAVVTNIEADHLENYPGGMKEILENMLSFANHASHAVVLCLDDQGCRQIKDKIKAKVITYGTTRTSPEADYTLVSIGTTAFHVIKGGKTLGEINLAVPGEHNKLNALGALTAALELGLPFDRCATALRDFRGVARRFQVLGTKRGITLIDDYGHHPTEVKATLEAARQFKQAQPGGGRVVAIFQPHQPGRLRDLYKEFCGSFGDADLVFITDIYVARGGQIEGVNSENFVKAIDHKDVHYVSGSTPELAAKIAPNLQNGDLVLTIGAGDITTVGPMILVQLI